MAVIAFDAASSGGASNPATSATVAHTCTGTNLILWAGVLVDNSQTITGVTYNSVAMTQATTVTSGTIKLYLFYLANPATGTNNIVATASGGADIDVRGASYTGAQGTADNTTTVAPSTATSIAPNLNSVADNCWMVAYVRDDSGGVTAGTNTVLRTASGADPIGDSNGPLTPAGSFTLNFNGTSGTFYAVAASFAPFTVSAVKNNIFGFFEV